MQLLFPVFSFFLLISCSGSKESTNQKNWTFEEANALYVFTKSTAPGTFKDAKYLDINEVCNTDSSTYAVLENGSRELLRKIGYPPELRRNGVEGRVRVEFTVFENGRAGEFKKILSPSYELTRAVTNAIKDSKFVPAFCNRKKVDSSYQFEFTFKLAY